MTILAANNTWLRAEAQAYLDAHKGGLILDVGGAAGPWGGATHILDIQPGQAFVGDIGRLDIWETVRAFSRHWDLVVCTHTLEDLRDPGFVLDQINTLTTHGAGFIAVPHKHTELSNLDSQAYVGYCHHRWVFAFQNETLRLAPKWPVTSRFGLYQSPGPDHLPWLDTKRAHTPGGPQEELGVLWEGTLPWEFIRGDFAGQAAAGCEGMLDMYRDELGAGL